MKRAVRALHSVPWISGHKVHLPQLKSEHGDSFSITQLPIPFPSRKMHGIFCPRAVLAYKKTLVMNFNAKIRCDTDLIKVGPGFFLEKGEKQWWVVSMVKESDRLRKTRPCYCAALRPNPLSRTRPGQTGLNEPPIQASHRPFLFNSIQYSSNK